MPNSTRPTAAGGPAPAPRVGPAPPRSVGRPRTLTPFVVTLGFAASLACGGGDKVSGPTTQTNTNTDLTCPSANVPLCTSASGAAVARDGTSDASTRSVAALENGTAKTALTASLTQLDAALVAQNVTNARAAVTASRNALTAARTQSGSFPGDAADLDVIELMLDYVGTLTG